MTLIYKEDKTPPVVLQVLNEMGWIEFDEDLHQPDEWNLNWKSIR